VRDPVIVDAAEYAALRAVATAALTWSQGTLSGLDLDETIRRHRATLTRDQDPGLHLAWPDANEEREPVPGVNYLPAVEGDNDRNHVDRKITCGDVIEQLDPVDEDAWGPQPAARPHEPLENTPDWAFLTLPDRSGVAA
jgi:hypothetical protein